MEENKTIKQYSKEAKKRLKTGFWQSYRRDLKEKLDKAKEAGVAPSSVKEFCARAVKESVLSRKDEDEEFYRKVKAILDSEGEISDAIGRLTDKEEYERMSYAERQKYTLSVSERYLKAVERYNREKTLSFAR